MSTVSTAALADAVAAAFERIHDETFRHEPISNSALEVEVIVAGEIDTPLGPQVALVLITPWAMNGMVLPGRGLPASMEVTRVRRDFIAMELPGVGSYAQVTLVGDVSKYGSQAQARTIAQSLVPVLLAGITGAAPAEI